jgi:hypothetical protein
MFIFSCVKCSFVRFTHCLSSRLKLKILCYFSVWSLYSLTAPWFCNYSVSTCSSIFWVEHLPHKVCSKTCCSYSHFPKQGSAASTGEHLRALKHTNLFGAIRRKHMLQIYTYQLQETWKTIVLDVVKLPWKFTGKFMCSGGGFLGGDIV